MEKASLLSNMKQMHDFKFKVRSFDFSGDYDSPNSVDGGFSWPPRIYDCSFCKREFRSAQALGGHMNVHRRDRARLRQSPTTDGGQFCPLNLNLEPNPSLHSNPNSSPNSHSNPNSSPSLVPSSSPPPKLPHFTSKLAPPAAAVECCRPIAITTDFMRVRAAKGIIGDDRFDSPAPGVVRLELEIGLISPSKEELDLELRLGF